MGTYQINAWGNSTMDYRPIKRGVEILLSLHATETVDKLRPN